MNLTDVIGYTAAAIGSILFLPQVIKSWRTKKTKQLSFLTYALITIAAILWIIYGFLLSATPVIFVNSVILCLSILILVLKLRYG